MKKIISFLFLSFCGFTYAFENVQNIELSNKGTLELYDSLKNLGFTEQSKATGSQIELQEILCNTVFYTGNRLDACNLAALDKALYLTEAESLKLIKLFDKMELNKYFNSTNKNTIHIQDLSCTSFTPPGPDERIVNCTLKLLN